MRVIKFGGTSVFNIQFLTEKTAAILNDNHDYIIVLSALPQTTNFLEALTKPNSETKSIISEIEKIHTEYINQLISDIIIRQFALNFLSDAIKSIKKGIKRNSRSNILAIGEYLSTNIYSQYLKSIGVAHQLKDTTEYIFIDEHREPVIEKTRVQCQQTNWSKINVFQGFICTNHKDETATLSRGGSDFTATLLAEATNSEIIEIWTDTDGLRSNDPRFVENTQSVKHLNYHEAAELAYFGAKILHPESVLPAQRSGIPIYLKNSKNTNHQGTVINNLESEPIVKSIASKDNITLVNVSSYRMLMAYGFLSRVFEVFNRNKTAIDLITTSEVSISLSIDSDHALKEITEELNQFSQVSVKNNMSIISVVGNFGNMRKSIAGHILKSINNPIEIMSYGTNRRNISILVDSIFKTKNLNEINSTLKQFNSLHHGNAVLPIQQKDSAENTKRSFEGVF